MNDLCKITMDLCISSSTILLTGRDAGKEAREKLELGKQEEKYEKIQVSVPDRIVSFNSSYFLGMFTQSIKKYGGRDGFLNKYTFICDEYIQKDIDDGIKEALKESNVLK